MAVSLEVVSGIGPAVAEMLRNNGFESVEDLASASVDTLVSLPGFGPSRATQVILRANEYLAQADKATEEADTGAAVAEQQDAATMAPAESSAEDNEEADEYSEQVSNANDNSLYDDSVLALEEEDEEVESQDEQVAVQIDEDIDAGEQAPHPAWNTATPVSSDDKKKTKKSKNKNDKKQKKKSKNKKTKKAQKKEKLNKKSKKSKAGKKDKPVDKAEKKAAPKGKGKNKKKSKKK